MELLSVGRARATWIFDVNDLNPRGKTIFPALIDALKENYAFSVFPKSPADVDENKGLSFTQGSFKVQEKISLHVELTVFSDGFAANSYSSTMDTEKFLEDVLTFASREFHLPYSAEMIRRKIVLSEVVVRLDGTMAKINPKLNDFRAKVSEAYKQMGMPSQELRGISFWSDPTQAVVMPANFTIEHKLGAPFSENRYYSKASLHTDKHLKLINDFEQSLMK